LAGFDRTTPAEGPIVQGFADGDFIVSGGRVQAVLLTPLEAVEWSAPAPGELTLETLGPLLALDPPPEFILLGTGPSLVFPPRLLVRELEAQGIGIEAMDSRAAARAWGLLRGEGRWIAAALMPLG
jgi:uncharacterized protein